MKLNIIINHSLLLLIVRFIMILLINCHYIKLEESNSFFDDNVDLDLGLVTKEGHIYNLEHKVNLKTWKIFRYETTNLLKLRFLLFVLAKGKQKNKSKIVIKFLEIIIITTLIKHFSQISSKTFTTQYFFHWSLEK